ncbi:tyrosine-type recombinase/integrase [Nonomuraea sp. NPDC050478]|uniref:tyrosine-type recombinase/integrase n=1 Tax=Nonomuraea sp. NPDC050478 TaxID=3364365 RepID=UPI00378DF446
MTGNPFRRCKCRQNGRELGAKCPKLRRKDGSWNPRHGVWYGKEELPPGPDGKRSYLKLGGFASADEVTAYFQAIGRLLDIPDPGPDGHQARMEILAVIKAAHRKKAPMPEYEEVQRKFRAGQPLQAMTFGEYWKQWVVRRRRLKDIRESTLIGYISHHDTHFGEVLDEVRLDRLFAPKVEEVFTRIDEKNAALLAARESDDPQVRASVRGKRPTGSSTKQRVKATIRTVLADAERDHLVSFNAATLVKLDAGERPQALVWTQPRVEAFTAEFEQRLAAEQATKEKSQKPLERFRVWLATPRPSPVMVWTPAQLGAFLDHAVPDRLYALYHLVAFRGLRRGEACGARWVDGELEEGVLTVAKQLSNVGGRVEEGKPKSRASEAAVALDSGTLAVLRAHRRRQLAEKLAWGSSWKETGRIFTQEDGSELTPDWVSEHFWRLVFAAGLPPIRLHDLRHGAATLSLAAGTDMKYVSAMLRHSSIGITSDIYTAVLPDVARAAAEAAVRLVPRKIMLKEGSETGGPPSVPQAPLPPPAEAG